MVDYGALYIKFIQHGKFVTLQDDTSNTLVIIQFNHIRRLRHTNFITEMYTLHLVQPEAKAPPLLELSDTMVPELVVLINTYKSIFSTPIGLPPRTHDHSILLLDGSNLVKVKPYRHTHSRKEEIEQMVETC